MNGSMITKTTQSLKLSLKSHKLKKTNPTEFILIWKCWRSSRRPSALKTGDKHRSHSSSVHMPARWHWYANNIKHPPPRQDVREVWHEEEGEVDTTSSKLTLHLLGWFLNLKTFNIRQEATGKEAHLHQISLYL